jgi:hypothetical protein
MSPTSSGGGTNIKTGGEHIFRLVETPLFQFCLWQNWNNGVIILKTILHDFERFADFSNDSSLR